MICLSLLKMFTEVPQKVLVKINLYKYKFYSNTAINRNIKRAFLIALICLKIYIFYCNFYCIMVEIFPLNEEEKKKEYCQKAQ